MAKDPWDDMTTAEKLDALRSMALQAASFDDRASVRVAEMNKAINGRLDRLEERLAKLE